MKLHVPALLATLLATMAAGCSADESADTTLTVGGVQLQGFGADGQGVPIEDRGGATQGEGFNGNGADVQVAQAGSFNPQAAPAQRGSGRGLPPGALRFEKSMIVDRYGFEMPLAAATLFLPQGWQAQGEGIVWAQDFMCTNGYSYNWSARSPDGATTIALLPHARWEANNYGAGASTPGCKTAPYTNVRQYLESLLQAFRAGARVLDYRPREDLQRQFAHLNKITPMPMGEARTWVESGEILFAYNEQGIDMRGAAVATAVFSLMRTNPGVAGMPVMDVLNAYAYPGYAVTAPNGQLNLSLTEAIRQSIKTNPRWDQKMANHNAQIALGALVENRKRADIIMRSNAEVSRIREEAWNSSQESADRRAREFGELIRGVETYDDPNAPTGQAELSGLYDHAWRLNDGSYVLTNDTNFEPWRDLGLEGNRLEATR